MTTLYRPVLIESAEQAEALPVGTVVLRRGDSGPWQKVANRRMGNHYRGDLAAIGDPGIVSHTALVPIEAEEETFVPLWDVGPTAYTSMFGETPRRRSTRYVTPWEESQ